MSLILRKAKREDLPTLIRLIEQLGYQIDDNDLAVRLVQYGEKIRVAVLENQVVGCLAYQLHTPFHSKDTYLRIMTLVVDQTHRGKGIGKRLIQEVEEIAKEDGCQAIELTSGHHRAKTGAYEFYTAGGFNNDSTYFRKWLTG